MWKHLRCQQLDVVPRATLVVSNKRGVLTIVFERGVQQKFSMVAVKHDLRPTGK